MKEVLAEAWTWTKIAVDVVSVPVASFPRIATGVIFVLGIKALLF
jgi:hypothetical protein